MISFSHIGLMVSFLTLTFISGFFYGRYFEQQKIERMTINAYQNAGDIQNEINNLDNYNLCISFGGLPDICKVFMRGLDQTTQSQ